MMKRYADITVEMTIEFDDEDYPDTDLRDAAHEALLMDHDIGPYSSGVMGINLVGDVRDTELPRQ